MTIIHNYLKKERIFLSFSFLALFSLVSCQKQPNLIFGSTYVADNNGANIIQIDTSTVLMSTVYTDSTATAGTGFLLVGNLQDPSFGAVSSRSFLQVAPPGSAPAITNFDRFDSISLIMLFKKGNPFYGDSTQPQSFVINQVDSLYQTDINKRGYFSNSTLPLDPSPLGSASGVTLFPNVPYVSQGFGDSLKIRMNDALGNRLFNMYYNKSDSVLRQVNFLAWFHGLCISPGAGSQGAIYGFRDSAIMRIYYRKVGVVTTQAFIDFTITNKGLQFNNVSKNWAGTPLMRLNLPTAAVQDPPSTSSDSTGNAGYVQGITGLGVKLVFPNLNSIALRPDYLGLLRAQLTIRPVPTSFSTTYTLPPTLSITSTSSRNLPGSPVAAAGGGLTLDYFHPLNTAYTYDVSAYIKAIITSQNPNNLQPGILINMTTANSFQRALLSNKNYPINERITLSVYYISLYPHQ